METCDETLFPLDVLHRLDLVENVAHRLAIIKGLEDFYRKNPVDEQTRQKLMDKILFLLTKYNPISLTSTDLEFINAYFDFLIFLNQMTIDVIAEFIYWYLDGGERLR